MPVSFTECMNVISSLKSTKTKLNSLPVWLFKRYAFIFCHIIVNLVNLSFSTGVFPTCLKDANITPIHKKGSKFDLHNYRPISTLPYLSKVFEKLLNSRLKAFVCRHNLLSQAQHGFQQGQSTQSALLDLMDHLYNAVESRNYSMAIFLDYQKAFDSIDQTILLRKLDRYGIRGIPLNLISSYLCNRRYRVCLNDYYSDYFTSTQGVPQGSILAPLLFNLFINDICYLSDSFKLVLYADDTTLIFSDSS